MKQYLLIALLVITTGCSSINLRGNRDRFSLSAEEKKAGYEILFDGKDMLRWTSNTDEYKLEDGCIVMQPADGHGNLYTKKRI